MANVKRELSVQDLAAALSITARTVRRYTKRGCPCSRGRNGNRFNLEEVRAWLADQRLTGKPGRPTTEEGAKRSDSKARLEAAKAAKAEIELAHLRREMLPRDLVVRVFTEFCSGVRDTLLNAARAETPDNRAYALEFSRRALQDITEHAERLAEEHLPEPQPVALEAGAEEAEAEEEDGAGHA